MTIKLTPAELGEIGATIDNLKIELKGMIQEYKRLPKKNHIGYVDDLYNAIQGIKEEIKLLEAASE